MLPQCVFQMECIRDHKLRNTGIDARAVTVPPKHSVMMAKQIYTNMYELVNINLAIHLCSINSISY